MCYQLELGVLPSYPHQFIATCKVLVLKQFDLLYWQPTTGEASTGVSQFF